ncbi:unnamed protein product, partial [Trichobilharzia regenti]
DLSKPTVTDAHVDKISLNNSSSASKPNNEATTVMDLDASLELWSLDISSPPAANWSLSNATTKQYYTKG